MAQDAAGQTSVRCAEVPCMRQMMDALEAFGLLHGSLRVRMENGREEGRQEHCQQQGGKYASSPFHKSGCK